MNEKFILYGKEIEIDEYRINYIELNKEIEKFKREYVNKFNDYYEEHYSCLKEVVEDVENIYIKLYKEMIECCVSKLINLDIYDYDIEKMIKYCEKKDVHEEWKKSYEKVSDLYFEIVLNQEEMDEYRRERRENRTRVEAMGFGLSGLATGMATAGAINLVTGLGHGAFNLIGKGLNAIGNKVALSSRFNNPETKQCLLNGVASLLVNVFSCYMYIVNEKKGNYYKYTTVTESNECEPIYINLSNNLIKDENKKIELICTIINKCPYTYKYYVIAFNLLGDKDGELQRLADFCNVGLKDYKINILNQEFNKIMESVKTEDEAKSIKERIIFRCNELHISSNNYVIDNIDDILAEFDLKQRTVEGIVFDTREMANDAKNELVAINNDYSDKIRNVYEDGNWKKLDSLKKEIKDKCRTEISQYFMNQIDILMDEVYNKRSSECKNYYKTLAFDSEEVAKKSKEKFMNFCDTEHIYPPKDIIDEIDDVLNKFDIKYRTVNGVVCDSRESADIAREEVITFDKNYSKRVESARDNLDSKTLNDLKKEINDNFITEMKKYYLNKIDSVIRIVNKEKIKKCKSFYKGLSIRNEDEAMEALSKLEEYCKEHDMEVPKELNESINNKLNIFDKECRTVSNIEFQSREEAKKAESEKEKIEIIMSGIDTYSVDTLLKMKKKIDEISQTEIKEQYISKINNRIEYIEKMERRAKRYICRKTKGKGFYDGKVGWAIFEAMLTWWTAGIYALYIISRVNKDRKAYKLLYQNKELNQNIGEDIF